MKFQEYRSNKLQRYWDAEENIIGSLVLSQFINFSALLIVHHNLLVQWLTSANGYHWSIDKQ